MVTTEEVKSGEVSHFYFPIVNVNLTASSHMNSEKDNKRLAVSLSYGSFAERLPRNLPSDCVSSACGTDYPQTSPSTVNIVPMFTVLRSMW